MIYTFIKLITKNAACLYRYTEISDVSIQILQSKKKKISGKNLNGKSLGKWKTQ